MVMKNMFCDDIVINFTSIIISTSVIKRFLAIECHSGALEHDYGGTRNHKVSRCSEYVVVLVIESLQKK